MLTRVRTIKGKTTTEICYGITSLTRDKADADELLRLVRSHWGIENSVFHVRDVTMGEDRCRVRTGQAPKCLAAIRNLLLAILAKRNTRNRAEALRAFSYNPANAWAAITEN